jgi:hypothetical protein
MSVFDSLLRCRGGLIVCKSRKLSLFQQATPADAEFAFYVAPRWVLLWSNCLTVGHAQHGRKCVAARRDRHRMLPHLHSLRARCEKCSESSASSLLIQNFLLFLASDSRLSFARWLSQVVGTTSLRLLFWLPSMPFAGLSSACICGIAC